jgi:4-hydroxy-tetrahydrodipicolinate synthase
MFAGAHTALITPFRDREFDEPTFRSLIDRQFEGGISGVVPVGTTGESPTLNHSEHERVIEVTIEQTASRGLVIAGTGSNSTREAISLTQAAEKSGADAALLVCPYYNKPSQEGLFQHYRAIAEATALPLILYSIPGRCSIEISVETTARLAESCPNIRAIKEAGGSVERVSQLRNALPESFEILSGDDSMTLPFMSVGACGVISVASNLIPRAMAELVDAMAGGDLNAAQTVHHRYYDLFAGFLKLATNPIPIKTALGLAGRIPDPYLRLPLVAMDETGTRELRDTLARLELL